MTSRTFLASVSAVVNCGATPVFADVERDSQNISAATISPVLSDKTKAIVCVHLAVSVIWIRSCNWLRIETFL